MASKIRKNLLTGGSCSGKSAVIKSLDNLGHKTIHEAALMLIHEELARGGDIFKYINSPRFEGKVLDKRKELESIAEVEWGGQSVFIDRGIPDGIVYGLRNGRKPTAEYLESIKRFRYDRVFYFDLLPNYKQDSEKTESPEFRLEMHKLIRRVYLDLGYRNLIHVPVMSVGERVKFVLERAY